MPAGPRLQAVSAEHGVPRPRLQAPHADGRQVVHLSLVLDLNAALAVLPGREEEGAVDQGVSVKEQRDTDVLHISSLLRFNYFSIHYFS